MREVLVPVGMTIRDIIATELEFEDDLKVHADLNGIPICDLDVVPDSGSLLSVQVVPGEPTTIILLIAFTVSAALTVAGYATGNQALLLAGAGVGLLAGGYGAYLGFFGATAQIASQASLATTGGLLALGAASIVGSLIAPQPKVGTPGFGRDQSPLLRGVRNEIRKFQPIPRNFGRTRQFPPFGAFSYNEVIGSETYLRALFIVGYGPHDVDVNTIRIGDTPLTQFDPDLYQVEIRNGFPGEPWHTIFPANVVSDEVNVPLIADGDPDEDGGLIAFQSRTSAIDTDEIGLDFHSNGLAYSAGRGHAAAFIRMLVEIEPSGGGGFNPVDETTMTLAGGGGGIEVRETRSRNLPVDTGASSTFIPIKLPSVGPPILNWRGAYMVRMGLHSQDLPADPHQVDGLRIEFLSGARQGEISTIQSHTDSSITISPALTGAPAEDDLFRIIERDGVVTVTGEKSAAPLQSFFVGVNFPTPSRDQWTVRLKILDTNLRLGRPGSIQSWQWIGIKSINMDEILTLDKDLCTIALQLRQSDQLSGFLDGFNLLVEPLVPYHDGAAWQTPTAGGSPWTAFKHRKAAWALAEVARGAAATDPQPDSLIDHEELKDWADLAEDPGGDGFDDTVFQTIGNNQIQVAPSPSWPDLTGFRVYIESGPARETGPFVVQSNTADTLTLTQLMPVLPEPGDIIKIRSQPPWNFDASIDFYSSLGDVLRDIAGSSNASLRVRDGGVLSVVVDRNRSAESPTFAITPANCKKLSFGGRKTMPDLPHAFRASFRDMSAISRERIVYRDGFDENNATLYEPLETFGIIDPDRAHQIGRHTFAQMIHRSESFAAEVDVAETVLIERGDLGLLAHDAPIIGISYTRIKSVTLDGGGNCTSVDVEEEINFESGKNYAATIRRESEFILNVTTTNPVAKTNTIVFNTPIPAASAPAADQLLIFGEAGTVSHRVIVTEIVPRADMTARVLMVAEAPEIHTDLAVSIPEFTPIVDFPSDITPGLPTIHSVRSVAGGLEVSVCPAQMDRVTTDQYDVEFRLAGTIEWTRLARQQARGGQPIFIGGLGHDSHYDIRIRAISSNGRVPTASEFVTLNGIHFDDAATRALLGIRVTGIELICHTNDPEENRGAPFDFEWRLLAPGFGGFEDPTTPIIIQQLGPDFQGFHITIVNTDTGRTLRQAVVMEPRFSYTVEMNVMDGGPHRNIEIFVQAKIADRVLPPVSHRARNSAAALPALRGVRVLSSAIEFQIQRTNTDPDEAGVCIWMSETPGFATNDTTLVFCGDGDKAITIPVRPGRTYYYRYAAFDDFFKAFGDPAVLNISGEQSVAISGIPVSDIGTSAMFNLFPDGDFEQIYTEEEVGSGSGAPRPVTSRWVAGGAAATWQTIEFSIIQTSPVIEPYSGNSMLHYTKGAGPGSRYLMGPIEGNLRDGVWAAEGQTISVRFFARLDSSIPITETGVRARIEFYDLNDSLIGSGEVSPADFFTVAEDAWTEIFHQADAPAGTFYCRGGIQVEAGVSTVSVLADAFVLTRGIAAEEIVGGRIRATELIEIYDSQATPQVRVQLGKLNGTSIDHGIKVLDDSGNIILQADGLGVDVVKTVNVEDLSISEVTDEKLTSPVDTDIDAPTPATSRGRLIQVLNLLGTANARDVLVTFHMSTNLGAQNHAAYSATKYTAGTDADNTTTRTMIEQSAAQLANAPLLDDEFNNPAAGAFFIWNKTKDDGTGTRTATVTDTISEASSGFADGYITHPAVTTAADEGDEIWIIRAESESNVADADKRIALPFVFSGIKEDRDYRFALVRVNSVAPPSIKEVLGMTTLLRR